MESLIVQNATCPNCGKAITGGRRGKKFCSDRCRHDANNRRYAVSNQSTLVRNITHALLRNRKILELTLGNEESVKVPKTKMKDMGFNFNYYTSTHTTGRTQAYVYCFDLGYLPLQNDWYLVVKMKQRPQFVSL